MKDAVATMGAILPDDAGGRDAVHVAVIAVVADGKLAPGQDVGLLTLAPVGDRIASASAPTLIGIVDPFIKGIVWPGQRFWLYLYPRTITALSHRWSHPAFPDVVEGQSYSAPSEQLKSKKWITEWAEQYGCSFADMVEAARSHVEHGSYFVRGGTFEGESVPDEFWDHYQRVTGTLVDSHNRENFFSCSC
jgi:hypothetical protein